MDDAPAQPARLRVVSWNIRAAIGPGEPFPPAWWRRARTDRLASIGAFLAELDPDVATLQEVAILTPNGDLVDEPAELARLTDRHVRYAAVHAFPLVEPETGRSIGMASWGNAVLTREPLVDGFARGLPRAGDDDVLEEPGATHPLSGEPHPLVGVRYGDTESGHREPRCVVGGRLSLPHGRDVLVATTHLTYIGRAQRGTQAAAATAVVADAAGSQPLVLTGDFNAPIDAPELAPVRGAFDDAFAAAGIPAGDERRLSCGPWPIDHALVRGFDVVACRVATEAGDRSDHWPVVADLAFAGGGSG